MNDQPSGRRDFVGELYRLADEGNKDPTRRGTLAALRRGLGKPPGLAPEMHPFVVPLLPDGANPSTDANYYLIASLFAWHPAPDPQRSNLGGSFARIEPTEMNPSIERRFMALLGCDAERLPYHLRQAIGLLRAKNIAVNWHELLVDVRDWENPERKVQRRWARAFWGARRRETEVPEADAPVVAESELV